MWVCIKTLNLVTYGKPNILLENELFGHGALFPPLPTTWRTLKYETAWLADPAARFLWQMFRVSAWVSACVYNPHPQQPCFFLLESSVSLTFASIDLFSFPLFLMSPLRLKSFFFRKDEQWLCSEEIEILIREKKKTVALLCVLRFCFALNNFFRRSVIHKHYLSYN